MSVLPLLSRGAGGRAVAAGQEGGRERNTSVLGQPRGGWAAGYELGQEG